MANQYIVSARKYRPQRFTEVVGQSHVTETLKNALRSGQLAHSFLFCGPRGVGKTTCARILAKALNCLNRTSDFEPCNTCESCQAMNRNASFNIIEQDAASNNGVDDIRELISHVISPPPKGDYKVFIIDEVHMLSQQAFNAFLKTLEEPPSHAIFILATTEKHKIIPTILSRCQIYDFKAIDVDAIMKHLSQIVTQEGMNAEEEALHLIAQKADGALRDALSLFDRIASASNGDISYQAVVDNLNILDYHNYFALVDAIIEQDQASLLTQFHELVRQGFDPELVINGLGQHMRDLLVVKDPVTIKLLRVSSSVAEKYKNQSEGMSHSFILTALHLLNECDTHFLRARNKRLHAEVALCKLAMLSNLQPTSLTSLASGKK